jgi:hypothetical protein
MVWQFGRMECEQPDLLIAVADSFAVDDSARSEGDGEERKYRTLPGSCGG